MKDLLKVFKIYNHGEIIKAFWVLVRLIVLPSTKIDKIIPQSGKILDIGCGNGGLTNYLAIRSPKRKLLGIDLSKSRIFEAQLSVKTKNNPKFINADVTKISIPKVKAYLITDVLHHISYGNQIKLLSFITRNLSKDSMLVIKEVDKSNILPFLYGHLFEKILYPKEKIYARGRSEWESIFTKLGLTFTVGGGNWYFYDSTNIYTLKKK
jgi:ubiquinone/menaquinone biosynthesis C-methylase UbiE